MTALNGLPITIFVVAVVAVAVVVVVVVDGVCMALMEAIEAEGK